MKYIGLGKLNAAFWNFPIEYKTKIEKNYKGVWEWNLHTIYDVNIESSGTF